MLTLADRVRLEAKALEFRLPQDLLRAASATACRRLFRIASPYRERDDELKAIFLHVPKAAGSSVRAAIFGGQSYHIPARRYFAGDPSRFDAYYKFTFVRNPWERLYSAYQYLRAEHDASMAYPDHRWAALYLRRLPTFASFVDKLSDRRFLSQVRKYTHFRDQLDWLTLPGSDEPSADFIGRFENMAVDFSVVAKRLGIAAELPQLRVRNDATRIASAYTPRMTSIIGDIYVRDCRAFGYCSPDA